MSEQAAGFDTPPTAAEAHAVSGFDTPPTPQDAGTGLDAEQPNIGIAKLPGKQEQVATYASPEANATRIAATAALGASGEVSDDDNAEHARQIARDAAAATTAGGGFRDFDAHDNEIRVAQWHKGLPWILEGNRQFYEQRPDGTLRFIRSYDANKDPPPDHSYVNSAVTYQKPAPDVFPIDADLPNRLLGVPTWSDFEAAAKRDAALATQKATASGLTPDQGAEALQHSEATGLGPGYVAQNLDAVKAAADKASVRTALSTAPITSSWMAQSTAHAAAAKESTDELTFLEWLGGKYERVPVKQQPEAFATAGIDYQLPQTTAGEMLIPPSWQSHWAKGMLALRASLLGIKRDVGGLNEQDTRNLQQAEEGAAAPVPGEEGHIVREAVGASIEALPQMAGFLIGAPAFLLAQTYGGLRNHFSEAKNDDGSRKYTEAQSRSLSAAWATATTVALGGAASKLAGGTVGKLLPKSAQLAIGSTAADALLDLAANSGELGAQLVAHGVRFGQSALHGLMFMVGLGVANDLADQSGNLLTGGKYDAGRTWQAAKESAKGALMIAPLMAVGPAAGIFKDVGRAWKAHTDAADLASGIEAAKETKILKVAPEQAQPLIDAQAQQDPARSTAFIPVAAFDAAMAAAGHDPAEVANALADQGAAYQEAKATGGDVAVPMGEVLGKLAPNGLADALIPDAKMDADLEAMSLRQAQQIDLSKMTEALDKETARAFYASLPADEQIGVKLPIAADMTPEQAKVLEASQTTPTGEKTPDRTAAATPKAIAAQPPNDLERFIAEARNAPAGTEAAQVYTQIARRVKRQQSPALAAAGARAKEARDFDSALAAYAADRISKLPLGQVRPATYEQQAKVHALKMNELARDIEQRKLASSETKVITPQNQQGEPAHYRVVEANDLIASHTENSFTPNPAYPTGVQERDYRAEQGEQQKVARGGRYLEPSLVLSDTPTPVDGPPLVTAGAQRIVLGGNGRSMMLKRAYAEGGDAAERYKSALKEKAPQFGIDPAQVEGMKQPVLVREIDGLTSDAPKQDLVGAVRRFNEGLTQEMSPRIRAVAQARVLTPQTIASIGDILGDGTSSLRDLLREKPDAFLNILQRDGVINDTNRARWVVGGELSDEAKDEIEGMFLGRVMGSGERLQATAPSLASKVERAVPSLLRVAGSLPEANEIGDVQGALDLINEAKRRSVTLDDLLDQRTMFVSGRVEPRTIAMARMLIEKSAKDIGQRFKAWADLFQPKEEQGGLFSAPAKVVTPEEALQTLFAGRKDDISGPARPADGETLRTTTGAEPPPKNEGLTLTPQAQEAGKKVKQTQATLSEVQTQHRVNDHLAGAARGAKDAQKKIEGYLASRATEEQRAFLASAGPEYVAASDAILGAFGFRPPTNGSIDGAVRAITDNLGEIGFDPDVLEAILAKPAVRQMRLGQNIEGSLDGLTLDEAQTVQDALKSIRKGAHDALEVIAEGKRQFIRDIVARVKQGLANRLGGGGNGFSAASGVEGRPGAHGFSGKGKAILQEMLQPQELMRRVGLNDFYQHDFVEGRNRRELLQAEIGDHFYKHYILEMPAELKARRLDPVEGVGGKYPGKMVRQDLWELGSWMGSESSAERAARGLGVTEEQIHKTLDQLTKPEWDFIQSRWDLSDKVLWPKIAAYLSEKVGLPPPKIEARPVTTQFGEYRGGYNPARYRYDLGRAAGEATPEGVADAWGNLRKGFPAASSYFTKARAQHYFDVPDLQWGAFSGHLQAVTHYLAFDNFVSNFGRVLKNAEFRDTIRNADGLGEEALRQLDEFHRVTARGNVESAATGARQAASLFGGGLVRSRVGTAAFQLNLRVVAGQLSHIVAAMPGLWINPWHMARGVFSALDPRTYSEAFQNSRQLGYRWNDYGAKTREMLSGIGPNERAESRKWIDTAGWSLYHVMDGFLSKSIWEAAKFKSIAEQRGLPASEQTVEVGGGKDPVLSKAYRDADEAISRIMPPRNIMEQSSFARDHGVIGSMMLVRNFPNTIYNVSAMHVWDAQTQVHDASPGWAKAKAYAGGSARVAGQLLGTYLAVHILGRYLMGHGKEHDETYGQWLLRESLAAPLYQFGPAEDAADPFIRALVGGKSIKYEILHGHAGLRNAPALDFFNQAIRDIGDVSTPGPNRAAAGLRLITRLAGGPTALIPSLQYGYDLATGKANPQGPFGLASGLFYGKRKNQAQNPLSDIARARGE